MIEIFLYPGEANPNDVKLRDPTQLAGGGAAHELTPNGFENIQAFSTHSLNANLAPDGLENAQQFSTHSINATLAAVGFENQQLFSTLELRARLDLAGFANVQAFGTHSLNATLAPDGLANAQAFSTHSLNANLAPDGFANVTLFGQAKLDIPVVLQPTGFANAQEFSTHSLNATLAAVGLENLQLFGGVSLNANLAPDGLENVQAFGQVMTALRPQGFANDSEFGVPIFGEQPEVATPEAYGSGYPRMRRWRYEHGVWLLSPISLVNVSRFGAQGIYPVPVKKNRSRKVREEELMLEEAA